MTKGYGTSINEINTLTGQTYIDASIHAFTFPNYCRTLFENEPR